MAKENVIRDKSYALALRIVGLYKYLVEEHREYVMSRQVLRSGTSIGSHVREAEHAESRADFKHKMSIALKEANETLYWLDLLTDSGYIPSNEKIAAPEGYVPIRDEAEEVLRILVSIVKKLKT